MRSIWSNHLHLNYLQFFRGICVWISYHETCATPVNCIIIFIIVDLNWFIQRPQIVIKVLIAKNREEKLDRERFFHKSMWIMAVVVFYCISLWQQFFYGLPVWLMQLIPRIKSRVIWNTHTCTRTHNIIEKLGIGCFFLSLYCHTFEWYFRCGGGKKRHASHTQYIYLPVFFLLHCNKSLHFG